MAEAITKHHHAQQVLAFLSQTSEEHVSVEDLAAATKLGAVVYPILSSLHEQGITKSCWSSTKLPDHFEGARVAPSYRGCRKTCSPCPKGGTCAFKTQSQSCQDRLS
jgi:hypothetical protein